MQENPILPAAFIVGVPRSGTTLLRMMLDSHPEMAIPPESHFYFELFKKQTEGVLNKGEFFDFIIGFFTWADFGIEKEAFRNALEESEPFTLTHGLRAFYSCYAARFGKKRWGEKTPDYGNVMSEIERLLPEAHFLHIIRDGRDVALSRRHLWFGPGESILAQAEDWAQWIMRARATGGRCAHYREVRYEHLVADPEAILREVCDFLALPFRPEMLAYHETAGRRLEALRGWEEFELSGEKLQSILRTTTEPPQISRVGRWKREMTPADVSLFDEIAGPLLAELGYETGPAVARVSNAEPAKSPRLLVQKKSVSALLLTDDISDDAVSWFERVRAQVDEFVIWIDSQRASLETEERARQLASRIEYFAPDGLADSCLPQAVASCATDWILRLDSDEELSPEWDQRNWRELLDLSYTNLALPRRWITPSNNYIAAPPWFPDYQVRLFQRKANIHFPKGVHGVMEMEGRRGFCRTLALHHHVLRMLPRNAREAKVRFYQTLAGPDLGYFYLFEDSSPPEARLPQPSAVQPEREILRMGLLFPSETSAISLEFLDGPATLAPQKIAWAGVRVRNETDRPLCSAAPFPVYLSYHWLAANSRRPALFDGERTPIFPPLLPRTSSVFPLFLSAPSEPGDYILQVSLVQEGVRWFESTNPQIVLEHPVQVAAPAVAARP